MPDSFDSPFVTAAAMREMDLAQTREFLGNHRFLFKGNVLHYRSEFGPTIEDIVRAGGGLAYNYSPALHQNRATFLRGPYDAIVAMNVLEHCKSPSFELIDLRNATKVGGHIFVLYRKAWPDVETDPDIPDPALWRFTAAGMEELFRSAGLELVVHEPRGVIAVGGFELHLGGAAIGRKP
jgi:hypothetical protein